MGGHEGVDYSKYIKKDPAIERLASMRENLGVYSRMTWGRGISLALKLCIGIPLGYWITVRTTVCPQIYYNLFSRTFKLMSFLFITTSVILSRFMARSRRIISYDATFALLMPKKLILTQRIGGIEWICNAAH